jgi:Mg2+ and Co2+ transporter CorA
MNFSNQKLAIAGFVVAAGCVILGRWGLSTTPVRERDVLMVFAGGLLAGLALVRFFRQRGTAPCAPPPAEVVPPPPPPAPKTKS